MSNSPTSSDDIFHHFVSTPLDKLLAEHQTVKPEAKVLALFHRCVAEVPAYRRFLEAQGIKPTEIKSYSAFRALPLMAKANTYRLIRCQSAAWAAVLVVLIE